MPGISLLQAQAAAKNQVTAATVTVSGTVLNATTGAPIPRALVRLGSRSVLSNQKGEFEFREFRAGKQNNIQVRKPGFYGAPDYSMEQTGTASLRADQLSAPIELKLYPEALLTGTLTRPDGSPLTQVQVSVRRNMYYNQHHAWTSVPGGQTMTNAHGGFRLVVPPGDYKLLTGYRVNSTGEAIMPLLVPQGSGSKTSDVISLRGGTQQNLDLQPPVGLARTLHIQFDSTNAAFFPAITAYSKDGGRISLSARPEGPGQMRAELPSGTYTLTASQNNPDMSGSYAETTVTVGDRDVDGVILRFVPVSPISVDVAADSDATPGSTPPGPQQLGVSLESVDDDPQSGHASGFLETRNGDSSFHLSPGVYQLVSYNRGSWYIKNASYGTSDLIGKDLVVSPGAGPTTIHITVSDQTGSLSGTTKLGDAAVPCWVYLIALQPSAVGVYSARSDSDGGYNFRSLPPGSYKAIAFEQRYNASFDDPESTDRFASYAGSVTIRAGDKTTLDLKAVPAAEMAP